MKPTDIVALRKRLGLTQAELAAALRMGAEGRRRVREWEKGELRARADGSVRPAEPSGPVVVALELMDLAGPDHLAKYLAMRDQLEERQPVRNVNPHGIERQPALMGDRRNRP